MGFGFSNHDKEGITRATVGEGKINTSSDISDLNRDVSKVQETTKDSGFDMHMTIPIVNAQRMKEEDEMISDAFEANREVDAMIKEKIETLKQQSEKNNTNIESKSLDIAKDSSEKSNINVNATDNLAMESKSSDVTKNYNEESNVNVNTTNNFIADGKLNIEVFITNKGIVTVDGNGTRTFQSNESFLNAVNDFGYFVAYKATAAAW